MNLKIYFLIMILGLASFAQADGVPELKCPQGSTAMYLTQKPLDALPANLQLPAELKKLSPINVDNNFTAIRLDVCIDQNDKVTLERAHMILSQFSGLTTWDKSTGKALKVQGLDQVVFGNTEDLDVRLELPPQFEGDNPSGIWLISTKTSSGVVTVFAQGRWEQAFKPTSIFLWVGRMEEGDPFSDKLCEFGQMERVSKFQLDAAKFEVLLCTYLGGGETTGYDIKKLTIQDSSVSEGALTFEGEALEKVLAYRWNHHNACDSFVLTIDDWGAQYAATSAAMAGCGTVLPGAPPRTIDDQEQTTLYTVRYGPPIPKVKSLPKPHYLF